MKFVLAIVSTLFPFCAFAAVTNDYESKVPLEKLANLFTEAKTIRGFLHNVESSLKSDDAKFLRIQLQDQLSMPLKVEQLGTDKYKFNGVILENRKMGERFVFRVNGKRVFINSSDSSEKMAAQFKKAITPNTRTGVIELIVPYAFAGGVSIDPWIGEAISGGLTYLRETNGFWGKCLTVLDAKWLCENPGKCQDDGIIPTAFTKCGDNALVNYYAEKIADLKVSSCRAEHDAAKSCMQERLRAYQGLSKKAASFLYPAQSAELRGRGVTQ